MAIWMFNQLVEKYPEIYITLKKQYLKVHNEIYINNNVNL